MSELRLYCDLLMQQVHTIQESVDQDGVCTVANTEVRSYTQPLRTVQMGGLMLDVVLSFVFQTRNEASSLLSATCETFIKTLEECMKIANSKFTTDMLQSSPSDSNMSPVSPSPVQMSRVRTHSFFHNKNDICII